MFEKITFCNTMLSRFFAVLASLNGSQIKFFPNFFGNITLAKSLQNTGCAQKNQSSDFKKSQKNRFNNALGEGIAKNFPNIDFNFHLDLSKPSPCPSKVDSGREQMGSRTHLVSRRYGPRARVVASQRDPAFVKRPKGYAYD